MFLLSLNALNPLHLNSHLLSAYFSYRSGEENLFKYQEYNSPFVI